MEMGSDRNAAGARAFIALVARGTDTNMIRRGGIEAAKTASEQAGALITKNAGKETLDTSDVLDG